MSPLLHLIVGKYFPKPDGKGNAMIELLLEYGADINSRDYHDRTPLKLAMEIDCKESIFQFRHYGGLLEI